MTHARSSKSFTHSNQWPDLPFQEWKDTYATLHLWTQIVGKIRLVQTPWINHSWHSALYVTSRGLTSSPIPYQAGTFQIDFDFIDHKLVIQTSDDGIRTIPLEPRTVADFYHELNRKLTELNLNVKIHTTPNEVINAIPFEKDYEHAAYEPDYANRFWQCTKPVSQTEQFIFS